MKKSFLFPALLVVLFTFGSCSEDFLNLDPNQSISLSKAIQALDDYKTAVNGIYDGLQSSNYYGRYFVLVPDVMTNDVIQNSQANRARDFAEYAANNQDGIAAGMWNIMYNVINRANNVINAEVTLTAASKAAQDNFVGQAYALRALAHFDLVRTFAQHYGFTADNSHPGVPIVTKFDQNARPAKNTVKEVYTQVENDLKQAEKLITLLPTNSRHLSIHTVRALLARVYIYKNEWANAENFANQVITSNRYTLLTNANYAASWNLAYSSESIFEIPFSSEDNNGADALGRMYVKEGYGDYLPSNDLMNLIPTGDVRRTLFKADTGLGAGYGTLRVNKYPNPTVQNNTPVIRLSEMYLIRAEARANLTNPTGAQADVDLIRKRGLPTAPSVTVTGAALLDEIAKEKRIELMYEGHRLWELMRAKKGIVRVHCTAQTCKVDYPNNRFVLPIPQREIDANVNMKQNPGY